jgi:pyridoxal 5'-phosphate synthase pdxS subunit
VATPADAALMMHLGADGVFVGSGIFKSENPEKFARAIVQATTHYQDYELIAHISKNLGAPMKGIEISKLSQEERMQERGW